jgi:hypothetical protein
LTVRGTLPIYGAKKSNPLGDGLEKFQDAMEVVPTGKDAFHRVPISSNPHAI